MPVFEDAATQVAPDISPARSGRLGTRLDRLKDALARRPFLKNVSIMLTGAAMGQMTSILLSPILTRIYSPQQFGVLSVYTAILTILVVIGSLRYELTLTLAKSDEDAINLVAVCFCALFLTTILLGVASFTFPEAWQERLWPTPTNNHHIAVYRTLLIFGFLCLGGYFIALYLATRNSAFTAIARTRIYQGITGPVTQIIFGLLGFGAPGLLLGSISGQSMGTFGLLYRDVAGHRELLRSISWARMAALAKRYKHFPLIAAWAALIDAAGGNQLLYLLVSAEYSAGIAGFIFLAERIVSRPLTMIGTSILQVYVGEAGRLVSTDPAQLRKRFYQVVSRQFMMAVVWIAATNIGAFLLFSTAFGKDWGGAVVYLQAMSLGYLAQAIVLPVFHTLQILEKQALAACWQVGRLALVVTSFIVGTHLGIGAPWTIFCYSAAQALCCVILLTLMARSIQKLNGLKLEAVTP